MLLGDTLAPGPRRWAMPVPTNQQVIDALASRNVGFECRSCGNASSIKMDIAGVNLTTLGHAGVNAQTSSVRWTPMALLICGGRGDTRFYHLEWLRFNTPTWTGGPRPPAPRAGRGVA